MNGPGADLPNRASGALAWATFAIAAGWSVLIRVPLVINAPAHLDSDLAVDGLTLLDATRGHWRWHYPGTPFIGSEPLLFSIVPAAVWGANPETLVVGGVVAWLLVMAACFWLARRGFGPCVAAWSLVPLTFASTGAVWLSGRITGGHLAAAACHAGAFALLALCLEKPGDRRRIAALGFWCGLSLAIDSMAIVTLFGVVAAGLVAWWSGGSSEPVENPSTVALDPPPRPSPTRGEGGKEALPPCVGWIGASRRILNTLSGRPIGVAVVFLVAFSVGIGPRFVGRWVDPYDAYGAQFEPIGAAEVLAEHGQILLADCLPRLIAGHRLPGLESEPDPAALAAPGSSRRRPAFDPVGALAVGLATLLGVAAALALGRELLAGNSRARRAIVVGLAVSGLATLAGFVLNRNIFNSDNYRYLVSLLVPWSLGFGLAIDRLARRGRGGVAAAWLVVAIFAVAMSADLARWYARFGWIDDRARPVRKVVDDPLLAWLRAHPGVRWIEGDYWDVYRLAFLTGGRVRGAPFPIYPDRFPEWRAGRDENRATIVRWKSPESREFAGRAIQSGMVEMLRTRGVSILAWPGESIDR